ncbi:uncharacterized protein JCM15063_002982 [Sporobolomyces koalae]|uniref:uncharacterized protein n=1 Tax=Sporobolomyces koalae TaxID=500713 RepID=UPI0031723960
MDKPWVRQDTVLIPTAAFAFGFTSGLVSASKLASKQFLAENAHRLPTTVQGWYFYQKTKNYRVLFAAMKGGLVTGGRLGAWTGLFVVAQDAVERVLKTGLMHSGTGDDSSKVKTFAGGAAGTGLAAIAGTFYRLSRHTRGKRLMLGLGMGVLAGGTVDLRDWIKERFEHDEATPDTAR